MNKADSAGFLAPLTEAAAILNSPCASCESSGLATLLLIEGALQVADEGAAIGQHGFWVVVAHFENAYYLCGKGKHGFTLGLG